MIDAFAIALVTYAIDISLGKTIADKYDYKIDDNQVLIGRWYYILTALSENMIIQVYRCTRHYYMYSWT